MPDIVNAFPLSIYRSPMALDPQARAGMIDAIFEMGGRESQKAEGITWTGDVNGHGFLHRDPRFRAAFESFSEHLAAYLESLKVDGGQLRLYYTRAWATISRSREQIRPHRHLQSHISLVYYLLKPERSGGITFIDWDAPNQFAPQLFRPENQRHRLFTDLNIGNAQSLTVGPREGDVLIFPASTHHATEPNLSPEPRLSISVDVLATARNPDALNFLLPDPERWTPAC